MEFFWGSGMAGRTLLGVYMDHLAAGRLKNSQSAALSHFLATVARVFGQVILFFDRR